MERSRIPNSLKKYRRIAGLSQVQVAAILGLKSSCVCLWEHGVHIPNMKYLFQLSILYNTSPDVLYGDFFHSLKHKLSAHHEPIISNTIAAMTM